MLRERFQQVVNRLSRGPGDVPAKDELPVKLFANSSRGNRLPLALEARGGSWCHPRKTAVSV